MELNPTRLEFARRRRGQTQAAVAEAAGLSVRAIKAYEAGEKSPSVETLCELAKAIAFPIDFLTDPTDMELVSVDAVSFRALSKLSARKRDAGLAAAGLAVALNAWLDERFKLPDVDVPDDLEGEHPETAAEALRRRWGLGGAPIGSMVVLLEKHGVRVYSLVEDCHELDAFSTWRDATPFVFLNTMKSAERSRMDLAHELGHLVLHRTARPQGKEAEEEATRFGAAFLMPRASLLAARFPTITLPPLVEYKRKWGVALSALVVRLHRLGRLSDWQYRSLFVELSSKGYRTTEPNGMPREASQVLQKVLMMLREDGIGRRQLADQIRVNVEDLDRLVFGLCLIGVDGAGSSAGRGNTGLRLVE